MIIQVTHDGQTYILDSDHAATCFYLNHNRIVSRRLVVPLPLPVRYGPSPWYDGNKHLIVVYDLQKKAIRDFTLENIQGWKAEPY